MRPTGSGTVGPCYLPELGGSTITPSWLSSDFCRISSFQSHSANSLRFPCLLRESPESPSPSPSRAFILTPHWRRSLTIPRALHHSRPAAQSELQACETHLAAKEREPGYQTVYRIPELSAAFGHNCLEALGTGSLVCRKRKSVASGSQLNLKSRFAGVEPDEAHCRSLSYAKLTSAAKRTELTTWSSSPALSVSFTHAVLRYGFLSGK